MAKILITGSADGLGFLAAKELLRLGHDVVIHARNTERLKQALQKLNNAAKALTADLSSITETKALAEKANEMGVFDAVIHNAGIYRTTQNNLSADGLPMLFAVNSLAPYILTCLIAKPRRLIYLTSGMHLQGNLDINENDLTSKNSRITYSDTKLQDVILCMAAARKWPDVYSNAVNPGWVPTKMGGAGAPDSLEQGVNTQVWLAISDDPEAKVSGQYFHYKRIARHHTAAGEIAVQNRLLTLCQKLTGLPFDQ